MTDVTRTVTHTEAKEIARRLIRGAFRRDGERLEGGDRPQFSIPCRPDHDDDTLILAYIEQQEGKAAQTPKCAGCNGEGVVSRSYGFIPCEACNGKGF